MSSENDPLTPRGNSTESFQSDGPITLVLSGGGFRATLFHLGVLRYLREAQSGSESRIRDVQRVISVSGGSILAAHLLARWEQYTAEDPEDFARAARELVEFVQSDLRGRVFRRWLAASLLILPRLAGAWRRTSLLQQFYNEFLGDLRFSQIGTQEEREAGVTATEPRHGRFPAVNLVCTNLTTGEQSWFSQKGFFPHEKCSGRLCEEMRSRPVASAVAASSAFPPGFPPFELRGRDFGRPELPTYQLTDGGVLDNTGLSAVAGILRQEGLTDLAGSLIVSNAGAIITESAGRFRALLPRTIRVTDVMMEGVTNTILKTRHESADFAVINMSDTVRHDRDLTKAVQNNLERTRTDLDQFTDYEAYGLVRLGYEAAHRRLALVETPSTWAPVNPDLSGTDKLEKETDHSCDRRYLTSLLSRSDLTGSLFLVFAAIFLTSLFVHCGLAFQPASVPDEIVCAMQTENVLQLDWVEKRPLLHEAFVAGSQARAVSVFAPTSQTELACDGYMPMVLRSLGISSYRNDFLFTVSETDASQMTVFAFLVTDSGDDERVIVLKRNRELQFEVPQGMSRDRLYVVVFSPVAMPRPNSLKLGVIES